MQEFLLELVHAMGLLGFFAAMAWGLSLLPV